MCGKAQPPRTVQCANPHENPLCMHTFSTASPRHDVLCPSCRKLSRYITEQSRQERRRMVQCGIVPITDAVIHDPTHVPIVSDSEARPPTAGRHKGEPGNDSSCTYCSWVPICRLRAQHRLWVACELPDHADISRIQSGIIDTSVINTVNEDIVLLIEAYLQDENLHIDSHLQADKVRI